MKVTRRNFAAILPEVLEDISRADFIAVDTEFSGLWRRADLKACQVDSVSEPASERRRAMQTPLALSRRLIRGTAASETLHAHLPYFNMDCARLSEVLKLQASSMEFLSRNSFNWSDTFSLGIPFMSRAHEDSLRNDITEKSDKIVAQLRVPRAAVDAVALSADDAKWFDCMRQEILTFREECRVAERAAAPLALAAPATDSKPVLEDGEMTDAAPRKWDVFAFPHHILEPANGFRRRLIGDVVDTCDDLEFVVDARDQEGVGNSFWKRVRVVYVRDEATKFAIRLQKETERRAAKESALGAAVGFRRVIDHIASTTVPVIGHNCVFDWLHTTDKFVCPLPQDPSDWVASALSVFPLFFDTKFLLSSRSMKDKVRDSGLQPAFRSLQRLDTTVSFDLADGFGWQTPALATAEGSLAADGGDDAPEEVASALGDAATGVAHDSGYDAFMTGCVFVLCCRQLGFELADAEELTAYVRANRGGGVVDAQLSPRVLQLKAMANTLALSRCNPLEWNLSPTFPRRKAPSKAFMVYLSHISPTLSVDDVVASFVALAGARDALLRRNITWLDERSVFVQLSSATELQAATAAVDMLLAEGSCLPWGPASCFGTYESFLRRFADVFGAVCDSELLPPADDDKADKKRRREPDAPAAEMASPAAVLPMFGSDAVRDLSAEPVDVPPTA